MKNAIFFITCLCGIANGADPMESREWQATSGHKTEAKAVSATAASVTLELASGKTITLPLEKLVAADREAILNHFEIAAQKDGEPLSSGAAPLDAANAEHPIGKVTGP